jgi:hypothetical protein
MANKIKYNFAMSTKEEALAKEKELLKKEKLSESDKQLLSRLFEKAGDSYEDLKEKRISSGKRDLYQRAEKYAPYSSTKERIRKKLGEHEESIPKSIERITNESEKKIKDLKSKLYSILSIGFLASALFFVSSSLTGNVIARLNYNNSRFIGICFFACGLIFAFLYSRCRMKKKNAVSKTKNKKKKK